MAKKNLVKEPLPKQVAALREAKPSTLSTLLPLIACVLYLGVHFVPHFGSYDAMGSQWLYLVLVDLIVIIFLLAKKNEYDLGATSVFANIFSKLYLAFFVLAGLSIFTAINRTEAWVCYVRIVATVIAYFNISILLYDRADLFKWLSQVLGLILLIESFQTLSQFFNSDATIPYGELILSLKGTTGNKNIFAADLAVKIPFVIYCIHTSKLWGKLLNVLILIFAIVTVFIVSARASYLSILLIIFSYFTYCIIEYLREKKLERVLYRISYVLLPLFIAFFIAQLAITNAKNLREDKGGGIGSVTERLATINAEDNQVRLQLWAHAIDYTKKHPIIGTGIGNWKIASIPYQRTITNDLIVPVHSHNDFLEMFAELGIVGGLLYLALFVCLLIFTIKVLWSKANNETKLISLFSFLSFIGYSIDAFFNFPIERPISQLFFALITGINVNAYIDVQQHEKSTDETIEQHNSVPKTVFALTALLFLMPATYVTYLTYQSLVVQRTMIPDLSNEPLKLKWNEFFPKLPDIPNLSASGQPIDAIKGRYLYEAGKYDDALILLNKGAKANPAIAYSEFLKAGLFFRKGMMDSAATNAKKAFYTRPRANTYYQTLIAVLANQKDTLEIQKAFDEAIKYRQEPYVWNLYLTGMLNSLGKGTEALSAKADSALVAFPGDPLILQRKKEILQFMGTPVVTQATGGTTDVAKAQTYYDAGVAAFNIAVAAAANKDEAGKKAAYAKAARNFLRAAEFNSANYIIYENAAISFFNVGEFSRALTYFDKVIAMKTAVGGKTEFFRGVALINLGRKAEGCQSLQVSKSKGYQEAENIINSNCK